jgi:hypothetical protein
VIAFFGIHLGSTFSDTLMLSVAPLVKTISFGFAPISCAICCLAFSTASSRLPAKGMAAAGSVAKMIR